MNPFRFHRGIVAPFAQENINTDAILPKQFMKSIERTGFGRHLFDGLRYLDLGEPGMDCSNRPLNPEFVLNQPRYRHASVLLARSNFGCGSSREHAPWAIEQFGFRALIAPSFADIFANNCFKNGLLVIELPVHEVERLFDEVATINYYSLSIDLETQSVSTPTGRTLKFTIESDRRERLLQGLDEIDATLAMRHLISRYEAERRVHRPWIFDESA